MSRVNLKKIILKPGEIPFAILKLMQSLDPTLCIQDDKGNVLFGDSGSASKYAIEAESGTVGWVLGETYGAELAFLLTELVAKDAEKKSLANEVLGLYREINLLYNLSEKLGTSLEIATVAQIGLTEAHSLIKATNGAVLLANEGTSKLDSIAILGDPTETQTQLEGIGDILRHVITSGKGELNNYIRLDPRYTNRGVPVSGLLCAPLRAKGQTIGAIVLMSDVIVTYMAADLKLLNTLASLVGPAIENALFHEKTMREAKEREEQLQRQIAQLKIELDQALVAKEVSQITETDYFQKLRQQAKDLRRPREST